MLLEVAILMEQLESNHCWNSYYYTTDDSKLYGKVGGSIVRVT